MEGGGGYRLYLVRTGLLGVLVENLVFIYYTSCLHGSPLTFTIKGRRGVSVTVVSEREALCVPACLFHMSPV